MGRWALEPRDNNEMTAAIGARIRMERATLGSLAIHMLAAISIPALAWTASGAPVETVSFTHILRIQIVRPKAELPRPRALAPHYSLSPSMNFAHRVVLVKVTQRRQATRAPIATNAPAAPAVAAVAEAGDSNANGDAAPAASSTPALRAVASVNADHAGGYLPFGAEQPVPVLDPAVRKELDDLGVHVTLVVTVGDDGHTTNVVFQPPLDPQNENRIRSLLADASWDPAVCGGGVSCEAQATIKL
jgi:pyruvate/2-oxoglutarate dehydrogenase complex dihydrolipoamide acyltransferase (E2) component